MIAVKLKWFLHVNLVALDLQMTFSSANWIVKLRNCIEIQNPNIGSNMSAVVRSGNLCRFSHSNIVGSSVSVLDMKQIRWYFGAHYLLDSWTLLTLRFSIVNVRLIWIFAKTAMKVSFSGVDPRAESETSKIKTSLIDTPLSVFSWTINFTQNTRCSSLAEKKEQ